MPPCPYANHRLRLDERGSCERCGGDLRLYAALIDLSVTLYNDSHRQWDAGDLELAATLSKSALLMRDGFREAHWLLGLIEQRLGIYDSAHAHLARAQELGAPVDPAATVSALPPVRPGQSPAVAMIEPNAEPPDNP
jgi:hypothetical protein